MADKELREKCGGAEEGVDKCGTKWDKVHRHPTMNPKETITKEIEDLLSGAFAGCHEHNLDGKKRLTIPSDWREAAKSPVLFVMKGIGQRCLYVFTASDMAQKLEKIRTISVANAKAQQFLRLIFSSADKVTVDGTGRIRVSDALLDYAGITGPVTLVGAGSRFELWRPETWNEQNLQNADPQSLAEAAEFIGF